MGTPTEPGVATGKTDELVGSRELLTPLPFAGLAADRRSSPRPRGEPARPRHSTEVRRPAVVAGLLALVLGPVVVALPLLGSTSPRAQAVVKGPGSAPGRVYLQVLGRAAEWDVAWSGEVHPDEIVMVSLTGQCRCVPVQRAPSLMVGAAWRRAIIGRGQRRPMERSASVLAGDPVAVVGLTPTLIGTGRRATCWFEVSDLVTGDRHGWLQMVFARRRWRPEESFRLLGGTSPGDTVALLSLDGRRVALPRTLLTGDPGSPVHPLTPVVRRLLGRDRAPVPGPSPAVGPSERDPRLVVAATAIPERRSRALVWLVAVGLGTIMVLAEAPGLVVVAIGTAVVVGLNRALGPWCLRPLTRAVQSMTGLPEADAHVVGRFIEASCYPAYAVDPGDLPMPTPMQERPE